MKLLGTTKYDATRNENDENVPHLEITQKLFKNYLEVLFVHYNIVKKYYQPDSRVLHTFLSYKSFGQLLDVLSKNVISSKFLNSEISYIKVQFTDQNYKPQEIEHCFSY